MKKSFQIRQLALSSQIKEALNYQGAMCKIEALLLF